MEGMQSAQHNKVIISPRYLQNDYSLKKKNRKLHKLDVPKIAKANDSLTGFQEESFEHDDDLVELVGTKQKRTKPKVDWGWDKQKNRLIGKEKKQPEVPEFHKETINYLDKKRNRRN